MPEARSLADIVRDMTALLVRHAQALEDARAGRRDARTLEALAESDAELTRFHDMCTRTTTKHLMSTGLRYDDELRHPLADGDVARVRTGDLVLFRDAETTILDATRMLSATTGAGPAVADWTGPRGIRLGSALALEHPRIAEKFVDDAQASLF